MTKVYENDKPIFPLELGKSYITRGGCNTGPLESHDNFPYVFWSPAVGMFYTSDGVAFADHEFNEADIIKPADGEETGPAPTPEPLQLAEGKYYRDGSGQIRGPAVFTDGQYFQFMLNGTTYTASGRFSSRGPNPSRDLIEEVEPSLLLRLEHGEEFETDDGRPVQIFTTEGPGDFPIVGVVGPDWTPHSWNADGLHFFGNETLNLVTPKKTIKANLFRNLKTGRYAVREEGSGTLEGDAWEWLSEHEIPLPPRKKD